MKPCYVCHSTNQQHILDINEKPSCEVDYGIPKERYYRKIVKCENCGVYNNIHNLINDELFYSGHYNASISHDLQVRFNKIISFDYEVSDNKQRVKRILEYSKSNFKRRKPSNILDVGSGTCVFLYEVKQNIEIDAFCIDPDPTAIALAKKNVDLKGAYIGTILDVDLDRKFDIITFNKVLEHVKNPINILKKALTLLTEDGFIYIELPESDRIVKQNAIDERAEFALEHYSVHNRNSLVFIAQELNLFIKDLQIITDPSGKFTIYGFMKTSSSI